jgi:hypothetical protein
VRVTPEQWAAEAEKLRVDTFAQGYRHHPVAIGLNAAESDCGIRDGVVLDAIECGMDQGLLDIQLGREMTVSSDPWLNMAASLARTWARLEI